MPTPREPGAAGSDAFQITRVFNAPAHLVFRAWTELESLKRWWGPKGFAMQSCTLDLKPGGKFHYCMIGPGGMEMWGKLVFREIVPTEKIVFVSSFSDKDGGSSRHPLAPGWPVEILSVVTFAEHHGKTTMTMRGEALNASESERSLFRSGFDSMREGWGRSLDQLDVHLAKQ